MRPLAIRRAREAQHDLWSLVPANFYVWFKIVEDVFSSDVVTGLLSELMHQCFQHDEFIHLCVDGTVRVAMRIRGQENYRASKKARNAAPIPDSRALRRVLGVRGRMGAVLLLRLVASEESTVIAQCMTDGILPNTGRKRSRWQPISLQENCSQKCVQCFLIYCSCSWIRCTW